MIEYGTVHLGRPSFGKWNIGATHLGNPIFRMTHGLWEAMDLSIGIPKSGSIFKMSQYKIMVIALDSAQNLIICINRNKRYWRFALLLYKVSTFLGLNLYA